MSCSRGHSSGHNSHVVRNMDCTALCLMGLLVGFCLADWQPSLRSRALWSAREDWTPLSSPRLLVDHPQTNQTALQVARTRSEPRDEEPEEDYEDDVEEFESTHEFQKIKDESTGVKKMKKRKGGDHVKLKLKGVKKLKKYMLPILIAYKLKFVMLIPILLGGMFMLMGTTAIAGFFFSLFAIGLGLKTDH